MKSMYYLLFILLGMLVIGTCFLTFCSNGKPTQFINKNGNFMPNSISEKIFVDINGVQQGMFIKSKNRENPVLLYLHGGMPDYFLTQKYPTGLGNLFTIVWWEQRGSGISYKKEQNPSSISTRQLIEDTKVMTNYLRKRFGKQKIYLMGHSGGTFIGIQVVAEAPELYEAYIGVAQISNQLESEKRAYNYMLRQFAIKKNNYMIRKLKNAPVSLENGVPKGYLSIRDQAMHSLGIGTMHKMKSVISGIFLPSLCFNDYTLIEKINLWKAKAQSGISIMWNNMLTNDLSRSMTEFKVPIYFFHGVYDYTVSYPLSKAYFDKINTPRKGFYTFEESAHSPMFEEPERMCEILQHEILDK